MASISLGWRQQGNKLYTSVTDTTPLDTKESRLLAAISKYFSALNTAVNDTEVSSAAKNYAKAALKLAATYVHLQKKPDLIRHYYFEALKHFDKAAASGYICQSEGWMATLTASYFTAVEELSEYLASHAKDTRGHWLVKAGQEITVETVKVVAYLEGARAYFAYSVWSKEAKDHKAALNALRECFFPLQEAKRICGSDSETAKEVNILEADIQLETCVAEAMQEIYKGDGLLELAVRDFEDLAVSMIWDAIDTYRSAVVKAREAEMEVEAMALSKIGHVFHAVLKIRFKAKEIYEKVIQLAESLLPMKFDRRDWYKESRAVLQQYVDESVQGQAAKEDKEKTKVRDELKDEMEFISNLAQQGDHGVQLMEYIYKTYPPKNKAHTLRDDHAKETKKALRNAMIHYHPDKQSIKEHGLRWKVLSEEITKYLSRELEFFK